MSARTVKREFYADKYNELKSWEIVTLNGGFYVREYIVGKQYVRGARMTKKQIGGLPLGRLLEVMK